jgi:hypothetical protein
VATVRARIALILGIALSALAAVDREAAASADPRSQAVQLELRRGSVHAFARPRYSKTGNDRDGEQPKSEVHSVLGLAVDALAFNSIGSRPATCAGRNR